MSKYGGMAKFAARAFLHCNEIQAPGSSEKELLAPALNPVQA
jgi:hypothetical protein